MDKTHFLSKKKKKKNSCTGSKSKTQLYAAYMQFI